MMMDTTDTVLFASKTIIAGMIVRIPLDLDAEDENFRDFRIGSVLDIYEMTNTALITIFTYDFGPNGNIVAANQEIEIPLRYIRRCFLLPDTLFTLKGPGWRKGRILISCDNKIFDKQLVEYYIQIEGSVQKVTEDEIVQFSSTRQDPDPIEQALKYELQNPAWYQPRNQVVMFANELRSVTYGIEDLVGSRVLLLAHQADVISRALSSPKCRLMLADEVGLGKTIEACVILKALRRKNSGMQTLIIAPNALTGQWHNELDQKFWLDLPVAHPGQRTSLNGLGVIVSAEDLESHESYWQTLCTRSWGLMIVDEAHHLRKSSKLYKRVYELSSTAERVLILTATPIQHRVEEYLDLLRLLDPYRYGTETPASFRALVDVQTDIRNALALVRPQLNRDSFDWEEFSDDISPLLGMLQEDAILKNLSANFESQKEDSDAAFDTAQHIAAYVSANYRIEGRMMRNRRASLSIELPQRTCDTCYNYEPHDSERSLLEALYEYLGNYLQTYDTNQCAVEFARILLHSAASSPHALLAALHWRADALRRGINADDAGVNIILIDTPRKEQARIQELAGIAPGGNEDSITIDHLIRLAELWLDMCEKSLSEVRRSTAMSPTRCRLSQALRALYIGTDTRSDAKIVAFSTWPQTIAALEPHIQRLLGRDIAARFTADMNEEALQAAADRFQTDPGCCLLLCDELGGEGRNFQIAQQILHIDIPWTPSQIEQRIGRVDRLGRTGDVRSLPIYARNTIEQDLFLLWHEALSLFTQSLSGLEIALEEIQDQIVAALKQSLRDGLANLYNPLLEQVVELREEVERERYFEEGFIDQRRHQEFANVSNRYRDGNVVCTAVQQWTSIAGVSSYHIDGNEMTYDASRFNLKSMRNARFLPPNMEDATRRARRQRTSQIRGTFNRDIAVRREDLVFFAPGDDPWTDAVIANALESDRGRCCAIGFQSEAGANAPFFAMLYTLQIDPRPLYSIGLDSVYLLQAQGYLACTYKQILIDTSTQKVIGRPDPRWKIAQKAFTKPFNIHLGKRGSEQGVAQSHLARFQSAYPYDIWVDLVTDTKKVAESFLDNDLDEYSAELATAAAEEFAQRIAGWEASLRWQASHGLDIDSQQEELHDFQRAAEAIVKGICRPIRRLESICFYSPLGANRHGA